MDEIYHHALKLLRRRDYTTAQLQQKLYARFGEVPQEIIERLHQRRFLDDARFAEHLVRKRADSHASRVRAELLHAGVAEEIVQQAVDGSQWPSLQDTVRAKLNDWKLPIPLPRREAARLFRALARLGYPEDEIREELEQLHEP